MNDKERHLLEQIAGIRGFQPGTAFNLRRNAVGVERHSTENVQIVPKTDQPGINIIVKAHTKHEKVHIPVVLSESGVQDLVYNDFYIEEGGEVEIIAGCGIHNDGCEVSRHDGIHTFHIGKSVVCGKAFGRRERKRGADFESYHHSAYGRRILYGNGYITNQGCQFYKKKDDLLLASTCQTCDFRAINDA